MQRLMQPLDLCPQSRFSILKYSAAHDQNHSDGQTIAVTGVSNFINAACLRKFEFRTMLRPSAREQIWQHHAEHPIVDAVAERDFRKGYSAALG